MDIGFRKRAHVEGALGIALDGGIGAIARGLLLARQRLARRPYLGLRLPAGSLFQAWPARKQRPFQAALEGIDGAGGRADQAPASVAVAAYSDRELAIASEREVCTFVLHYLVNNAAIASLYQDVGD